MKEAQRLRREKKKTLSDSCKKLHWHMKSRGTVVRLMIQVLKYGIAL